MRANADVHRRAFRETSRRRGVGQGQGSGSVVEPESRQSGSTVSQDVFEKSGLIGLLRRIFSLAQRSKYK